MLGRDFEVDEYIDKVGSLTMVSVEGFPADKLDTWMVYLSSYINLLMAIWIVVYPVRLWGGHSNPQPHTILDSMHRRL